MGWKKKTGTIPITTIYASIQEIWDDQYSSADIKKETDERHKSLKERGQILEM